MRCTNLLFFRWKKTWTITKVTKTDTVVDVVETTRREGVQPSRVSVDVTKQLSKYEKTPEEETIIKTALTSNEFLKNVLNQEILQSIVDIMYPRLVSDQEIIIKQGETGMHLYVSENGTFEIVIDNKLVSKFHDQRVFGELAILYDAKRLATVKACREGRLWVLNRSDYKQILLQNVYKEQDEMLSFLKNVPILNKAKEKNLQKASNLLKREFFKTDIEIVKEGDRGDKFYIIRAGTVTVTTSKDGVVATLNRGQFFGEKALLQEEFRQATCIANAPGVECLTLDREEFVEYLGGIESFVLETKTTPRQTETFENKYSAIELDDLKIIKTLGLGGFGRVELVQHKKDEKLVFALKYLKKVETRIQHQIDHVFNEKHIQMSCNSMFIVKLYKTFRDTKYLYFLMECCLGGDLWNLLQKQKDRCFDENTARFFAACVIEALAYLHSRDCIYRDLKLENILIDSKGYLKLTDFGFAKKLGDRGKTYTFAGTPEYVAPEIVVNKGHDKAVDYWAFGILVYELIVGKTPFVTNDTSYMKTYNLILGGIDSVMFPAKMSRSAQNLVKKLCRPKATDRLGCQKNGVQDIKDHKWFLGFDWVKLNERKLKAPIVPKLKGSTDTRHFGSFPSDKHTPDDDISGWDEEFDKVAS